MKSTKFNHGGEVIFVTPAMAKEWLDKHAAFQRPVNERKVTEWIRLSLSQNILGYDNHNTEIG